jgi:hypothetical protein
VVCAGTGGGGGRGIGRQQANKRPLLSEIPETPRLHLPVLTGDRRVWGARDSVTAAVVARNLRGQANAATRNALDQLVIDGLAIQFGERRVDVAPDLRRPRARPSLDEVHPQALERRVVEVGELTRHRSATSGRSFVNSRSCVWQGSKKWPGATARSVGVIQSASCSISKPASTIIPPGIKSTGTGEAAIIDMRAPPISPKPREIAATPVGTDIYATSTSPCCRSDIHPRAASTVSLRDGK